MLTKERIKTIYVICKLWAGIDRNNFESSLHNQNVTAEELREYEDLITVCCQACNLRFNILDNYFCDRCGNPLPLPEGLFLLGLKDNSLREAEHGRRIHGEHVCRGENFCIFCGRRCSK